MTVPRGISVWRVKKSIVAILTDLLIPGVADIVLIAPPGSSADVPLSKPRRVYLGHVVNDDPSPGETAGSQIRTEQYVIPLLVDCLSMTGNALDGAASAIDLLAAIVTAVEGQILDDPSWGAACHNSGLSLVMEATDPLGDQPSGSGWRCSAVFDLRVMRRGV